MLIRKRYFTIGVVAGIIGTIIMHLASMIFETIGLTTISSLEISARVLLNPAEMNTTLNWVVGAIVHLMIGSADGIALAYFILSIHHAVHSLNHFLTHY